MLRFIKIFALTISGFLIATSNVIAGSYSRSDLSGQTVTIARPWFTDDEENFFNVIAIFEKSKAKVLKALLADPVVDNVFEAEKLLNKMIEIQEQYLR